jgi:hypothetical protein
MAHLGCPARVVEGAKKALAAYPYRHGKGHIAAVTAYRV